MSGRIRNIRIIADLQIIEEPAGWTPAQLTSLKAWYKSDTGVTETSGKVSQWDDQSGNANHLTQANADQRPVKTASALNGYPSIDFDGIDDIMKTAAFTLDQPETVFVIFKQNTWTDGDRVFDGFYGNFGGLLQNGSSPGLRQYYGDFGPGPNTDMTLSQYKLFTAIFNSTNSILQVNNGTQSGPGGNGALNMGGFTLGAFGDGGSNSDISVVEVVVMGAAASDAERTAMKTYVTERYGITM